MGKYTTFIDEAGNTGDDLINHQQPFFVMAALMVPVEYEQELTTFLSNEFNIAKEKEEAEIKGAKWCKGGKKKQNAIKNIISHINDIGCQVFVTVVEKHYMIAGNLIQTFFDGEDNYTHCNLWINDKELAIACANRIIDGLSTSDLDELGTLYSNPSHENYLSIIEKLRLIFKQPLEQIMLDESEKYVDEIVDLNRPHSVDNLFNDNIINTPNLTVFNAICEKIAGYCKSNNCQTDTVFDNCLLCNDTFKKWIEQCQRRTSDFKLGAWDAILYSWKDRILQFQVEDSKNKTLLQISDIIALSISHSLIAWQKNDMRDFDKYILSYTKDLLTNDNLWSVMSNKTNREVFSGQN